MGGQRRSDWHGTRKPGSFDARAHPAEARMRLTLHTDYALRLLMYVAAHPGRLVPLPEIASAFGISRHHLAKVAQALRVEGYLEATRGHRGGLRLSRDPRTIRVGDIVRATEPDLALVACFEGSHPSCPLSSSCGLAAVFSRARQAFLAELDGQTLAGLVLEKEMQVRLVGLGRGLRKA